jgi:hypothetical protein
MGSSMVSGPLVTICTGMSPASASGSSCGSSCGSGRRVVGVFAGGVGPVFEEGGLQPAHGAAFNAQVHVVVGVGRVRLSSSSVMLTPPVKPMAAVADHDLAVGAVVGHRAQPPAYAGVVEKRDLAAGGLQRRQEPAAQPLGAQRIDQQAHDDALPGFLHQQVAQRGADLVGLEDVVLEVDVVARAAHRLEDAVEGARAARQQLDRGRTGHRQAAGGRAQCGHLPQGRGRHFRGARAAGRGRRPRARRRGCAGA